MTLITQQTKKLYKRLAFLSGLAALFMINSVVGQGDNSLSKLSEQVKDVLSVPSAHADVPRATSCSCESSCESENEQCACGSYSSYDYSICDASACLDDSDDSACASGDGCGCADGCLGDSDGCIY